MFKSKRKQGVEAPDLSTAAGFEQIYRTNVNHLIDQAYYRLQDVDIAKSVVQQVFCTLWERKDKLILEGPVEHYLVRAVKLAVMDHIRIEVNRRKHQDKVHEHYQHAEVDAEAELHYEELRNKVDSLVGQMPSKRQQVYKLSRDKELKNKEIALSLQITEKTVEKHLTQALKFLRGKLKEY